MHVVPTAPALLPLFDRALPNRPMLEAGLLGHVPARALVDDPAQPTAAVVDILFGLAFASERASSSLVAEALRSAPTGTRLVWRDASEGRLALPLGPGVPRMEFSRRDAARARPTPPLPASLRFVAMDEALVGRCQWRSVVERAAGSAARFLEHGTGVCLLDDQDVVLSEAYAGFYGVDTVEIGTVTHPDHRGRGWSRATCAELIRRCSAQGFDVYWSCDRDNHASAAVARSLGFEGERLYAHRPLA